MGEKREELEIEKRTLEQLLKDLREEKQWTYMHIVEELNKIGLMVDEKKVKKWEIGLEYPDINEIYKLSELYFVPSDNFVMAKSNSYKQGLESVHATLIKWVCYLTGISLKVGYVFFYIVIVVGLIWALWFFCDNVNTLLEVRKENF